MTCIRCHEREARGLVCGPCLSEPQRATSYSQIGSSGATAPKRPDRASDGLAPSLAPDRGAGRQPDPAVVVLPWSVLVSDNRRASITQGKAKWEAYRDAMAALREAIRDAWSGPKLTGPLVLIARFYEPDRRVRDCGNFRKALLDAMTGIVYRDDSQVADERYVRAGLSPDRPRVEVVIRAMSETVGAA